MLGHGAIGEFALGEFEVPTVAPGVGKPSRFKVDNLDEWLNAKKSSTFNRKKFDELQAAAEDAKRPGAKAALETAVEAVAETLEKVRETDAPVDTGGLDRAIAAATAAKALQQIVAHSRAVVAQAQALAAQIKQHEFEQDEEEAITLLLN